MHEENGFWGFSFTCINNNIIASVDRGCVAREVYSIVLTLFQTSVGGFSLITQGRLNKPRVYIARIIGHTMHAIIMIIV